MKATWDDHHGIFDVKAAFILTLEDFVRLNKIRDELAGFEMVDWLSNAVRNELDTQDEVREPASPESDGGEI